MPVPSFANCAPERAARRIVESYEMSFALLILMAVVVVALVLLAERHGDPGLLEREYRPKTDASKKSSAKQ